MVLAAVGLILSVHAFTCLGKKNQLRQRRPDRNCAGLPRSLRERRMLPFAGLT